MRFARMGFAVVALVFGLLLFTSAPAPAQASDTMVTQQDAAQLASESQLVNVVDAFYRESLVFSVGVLAIGLLLLFVVSRPGRGTREYDARSAYRSKPGSDPGDLQLGT